MLKTLIAAAVLVISQAASAQLIDVDIRFPGGHDRHDRYDRHDRRDRDHDRYGRYVCTTSSRGYQFRAEGRSQYEAERNVQEMCMRHPYGHNMECRRNTDCRGGGGGFPSPREYTCQTFGAGQLHVGRGPSIDQAQRRALRKCYDSGARPRQCERQLTCRY